MKRGLLVAVFLSVIVSPACAKVRRANPSPPILPPKPPDVIPVPTAPEKRKKIRLPLPLMPLPETTGVVLRLGEATPAALDLIGRLNLKWVRLPLAWGEVKTQRGVYDFSRYDPILLELNRRKFQPLLTLTLTHPAVEGGHPPSTPEGRAAFAAFAAAAVGHYKGKVKYWELGDAPNALPFEHPGSDYAELVKAAAPAMKKANSGITLLAGGTRGFDLPFMQSFVAGGLPEEVDGLAFQPRWSPAPEGGDDRTRLSSFVTDLRLDRGLPVWVLRDAIPTGNAPDEAAQARWIVREFLYNSGQGIPATLIRFPSSATAPAGGAGGDRPFSLSDSGAVFRAIEFMNRYLTGMKVKRTRELPGSMHGLVLSGRGKEVNVFWSSAGERTLTFTAGKKELPVFNWTGEAQSALKAGETTLRLTESPVYVEGKLDINAG